jgi:hypothetical protein
MLEILEGSIVSGKRGTGVRGKWRFLALLSSATFF